MIRFGMTKDNGPLEERRDCLKLNQCSFVVYSAVIF